MNNYFEEFNIPTGRIGEICLPMLVAGKEEGQLNQKFITYIIATQAKKAFSRLIVEKDKKLEFHAESVVFEKDPEALKEAYKKFQAEKNEYNRLVESWKNEHPDMFEKVPFIPSVSVYAGGFQLKGDFTVDEAIQGYKLANSMGNFIKANKTDLQTSFKMMIKPEYADEYKSIRNCYQASVGLPWDYEIEQSVTKEIEVVRTRLKLNRKPFETIDPFVKYASEYTEYLINLDPSSLTSYADENYDC